jgi:hypothetical protein
MTLQRTARAALAAAATVGTALAFTATPALAATPEGHGRTTQQLTCGDMGTLTLITNQNNSSDMGGWSVAQVQGGGRFIPVAFHFTVTVTTPTATETVVDQTMAQGGGHSHPNQATVECTQTESATVNDLLGDPEAAPVLAGFDPTDPVTFTFGATAIYKP